MRTDKWIQAEKHSKSAAMVWMLQDVGIKADRILINISYFGEDDLVACRV